MQLYALNSEGQLISARQALRHINYFCLECQQVIRLRGGPQRRSHFYHVEPIPLCRQHQKGPVHLHLQSYFFQQLPAGDCHLEMPFPSIGRIADVAWLSQQIVFEIQCSPISAEEVIERNRDYQAAGWKVVWILHDERYNQVRLSAAEMALHSTPHFFSNMNSLGIGTVYDQFEICDKGVRHRRLPPLPIDVGQLRFYQSKSSLYPLVVLSQRASQWKFFFEGDLTSLFVQEFSSSYLQQAKDIEKQFYPSLQPFNWSLLPLYLWRKGITTPYQTLFRFLLERMCR